MNKALELQPNWPFCINHLARLLATCPEAKIRNPKRALELAQKVVKAAPKEGAYWNTLGVAQYRNGHWKEAISASTRSMELLNGQLESLNDLFLAMAHWQLGQKEEARQWYCRAVHWMIKHPQDFVNNPGQRKFLDLYCAEAEELLGMKKK
jgi:Flp pilus assembly protein TadD